MDSGAILGDGVTGILGEPEPECPWNMPGIIDIYCVRTVVELLTFCNGGPGWRLSYRVINVRKHSLYLR